MFRNGLQMVRASIVWLIARSLGKLNLILRWQLAYLGYGVSSVTRGSRNRSRLASVVYQVNMSFLWGRSYGPTLYTTILNLDYPMKTFLLSQGPGRRAPRYIDKYGPVVLRNENVRENIIVQHERCHMEVTHSQLRSLEKSPPFVEMY